MNLPRTRVVTYLSAFPEGILTADLATVMGVDTSVLACRLSKLASCGYIEREKLTGNLPNRPHQWCVWRPKKVPVPKVVMTLQEALGRPLTYQRDPGYPELDRGPPSGAYDAVVEARKLR